MVTWYDDPDCKVESGAVNFSSDKFTVVVKRPENAISEAIISANDFDGKNYIANINSLSVIKVSFMDSGTAWTQVHEGRAESPGCRLDERQTVEVLSHGYGRALRNTHCHKNYGVNSDNPALDTPHEIWDDLIANTINKSFGGAATGYAILDTKIAPCANPVISFIEGGYRNNLSVINDVLQIYQGYRNGLAGMHWFVDENKALFINTIAAHENNATGWPTWWRTNEAGSTLVEGTDFLNFFFHKPSSNFANKIILYCNARKPGADIWSEGGGPTWSDVNMTAPTPDYSLTEQIVGLRSLRMIVATATTAYAWHPNFNAGWDFTKMGSYESIPTLNFYFHKDAHVSEITTSVRLCTTDQTNDYFECLFSVWTDPDNEWVHRSLPIGPHYKTTDEGRRFRWTTNGAPDWADINGVCWKLNSSDEDSATLHIDDLHFSGKIIREAFNSTSIAANDEVQKIIRYDSAVDDSLDESDDTGTAGTLAYAELLTRQTIPTVGTFVTPLAIDALPGQLIHVHANAHSPYGATDYRVNATMRVKEVIHTMTEQGAKTTWDVTSDVLNTFGVGFNEALTAFYTVIHSDPEYKNLKTTELDPFVERLTIDYP
jgi:hypothetical protein